MYKAAIFGESDSVTGVSSNIILGQAPPCGTGTVNVTLHEERFHELMNHSYGTEKHSEPLPHSSEVVFDFDD